jgi:peptide/nickel transport system permease protein
LSQIQETHGDVSSLVDAAAEADASSRKLSIWERLLQDKSVVIGGSIMAFMVLLSIMAPLLGTMDPSEIDPTYRNKTPGFEKVWTDEDDKEQSWAFRMGTDTLGRDTYSRVIYGTQVSLIVGITVAALSISLGLVIGMFAGYIRWLDGLVMRVMDGLMAIPGILLAIALVSLSSAGLDTVILAITIPEVPRVVRLVRSIVLSIREEPYVEAAISTGTRLHLILYRHVLPNTVAPLIVQGTYIVASAILVEAILSFLGAGIPPEIPTWGNIMAEGRVLFRIFPHNILFPGIFLAITVLAVNMLGDGLRDTLDPRLEKRT